MFGLGLDSSPDDVASSDNDNGWSWAGVWEDLSTNASSIWDSSLKTAVEVGGQVLNSNIAGQLTEKDGYSGTNTQVDNSGSTLDSNASSSNGNASIGGFAIDQKTMLIGAGALVGVIVLIKVL